MPNHAERCWARSCNHRLVVTELSAADAGWAAGLMERQRREYARYSPVFWRPAEGAAGLHARFLRGQISPETTVALRTRHGFIICQRRQSEGFGDDFTVGAQGTWDGDGAALLLAAERLAALSGVSAIRVVTAHADQAKAGMLSSLPLSLAEQWWVRQLRPGGQAAAPGRISGPDFSGILGPAPPVYDPGGPVFLADQAGAHADVDVIERAAAERGAVLAIIPAVPGTARARELHQKSWNVASDWYRGWPVPAYPLVVATSRSRPATSPGSGGSTHPSAAACPVNSGSLASTVSTWRTMTGPFIRPI